MKYFYTYILMAVFSLPVFAGNNGLTTTFSPYQESQALQNKFALHQSQKKLEEQLALLANMKVCSDLGMYYIPTSMFSDPANGCVDVLTLTPDAVTYPFYAGLVGTSLDHVGDVGLVSRTYEDTYSYSGVLLADALCKSNYGSTARAMRIEDFKYNPTYTSAAAALNAFHFDYAISASDQNLLLKNDAVLTVSPDGANTNCLNYTSQASTESYVYYDGSGSTLAPGLATCDTAYMISCVTD